MARRALVVLAVLAAGGCIARRAPPSPPPPPRIERALSPATGRVVRVEDPEEGLFVYSRWRLRLRDGRVEFAPGTFATPIVYAIHASSGWVFVSADGLVATAEGFLAPLRPAGELALCEGPASFEGPAGRGLAALADGARLFATDGSKPFQRVNLPVSCEPSDAVFADERRGVVSCEGGSALFTGDAGRSFRPMQLNGRLATGVAFAGGSLVLQNEAAPQLVGQDGRLTGDDAPYVVTGSLGEPSAASVVCERSGCAASASGASSARVLPAVGEVLRRSDAESAARAARCARTHRSIAGIFPGQISVQVEPVTPLAAAQPEDHFAGAGLFARVHRPVEDRGDSFRLAWRAAWGDALEVSSGRIDRSVIGTIASYATEFLPLAATESHALFGGCADRMCSVLSVTRAGTALVPPEPSESALVPLRANTAAVTLDGGDTVLLTHTVSTEPHVWSAFRVSPAAAKLRSARALERPGHFVALGIAGPHAWVLSCATRDGSCAPVAPLTEQAPAPPPWPALDLARPLRACREEASDSARLILGGGALASALGLTVRTSPGAAERRWSRGQIELRQGATGACIASLRGGVSADEAGPAVAFTAELRGQGPVAWGVAGGEAFAVRVRLP